MEAESQLVSCKSVCYKVGRHVARVCVCEFGTVYIFPGVTARAGGTASETNPSAIALQNLG